MPSGRKRSTRFNLESEPLVTGRVEDEAVERARMSRRWPWADRRTRLGVLVLIAIAALLLVAAAVITAMGWWPRVIREQAAPGVVAASSIGPARWQHGGVDGPVFAELA